MDSLFFTFLSLSLSLSLFFKIHHAVLGLWKLVAIGLSLFAPPDLSWSEKRLYLHGEGLPGLEDAGGAADGGPAARVGLGGEAAAHAAAAAAAGPNHPPVYGHTLELKVTQQLVAFLCGGRGGSVEGGRED